MKCFTNIDLKILILMMKKNIIVHFWLSPMQIVMTGFRTVPIGVSQVLLQGYIWNEIHNSTSGSVYEALFWVVEKMPNPWINMWVRGSCGRCFKRNSVRVGWNGENGSTITCSNDIRGDGNVKIRKQDSIIFNEYTYISRIILNISERLYWSFVYC